MYNCIPYLNKLIKIEIERMITLVDYSPEFQEYFFSAFLLCINGFIRVFKKEIGAQAMVQESIQNYYLQFLKELEHLKNLLNDYDTIGQFSLSKKQQ